VLEVTSDACTVVFSDACTVVFSDFVEHCMIVCKKNNPIKRVSITDVFFISD
jgi:hypothetical protein